MIPELDDQGYLPPGIHQASIDELAERFGFQSELRRVELQSLRWLLDLARRAGVLRLVVNGSFVTDAFEPNDVDCALLIDEDFPRDVGAEAEIDEGLPFLEIHVVEAEDFAFFVEELYATDRFTVPKGMVEVAL